MAQFFGEERSEFYAPFAEGFVADLNAALMQQFLHVSVTQGKAVIEPNGVLDDGHGETVAVGLGVGHGQSAYPDPIKATQPTQPLIDIQREKASSRATSPAFTPGHSSGSTEYITLSRVMPSGRVW